MIEKKDSYMTLQQNKKLKILFLVLFFGVVGLLLYIFKFYFWPFLFALIFYMVLKPINEFILRYVKKRLLSASIMTFFIFLIILVPSFFLLFTLANQSYEFYLFITKQFNPSIFSDFLHKSSFVKYFYSYLNISEGDLLKKGADVLQNYSLSLFSNLTTFFSFSIKFAVNFFFMILILFFLFLEGRRLTTEVYKALPFPIDIEKDVFHRVNEVIRILIAGNLLIMIAQGVLVGIGFFIAGLKAPLLLGSIGAIFSLVPVIGTSVVWVPAVIYCVAVGDTGNAVFLSIWCIFWYLILENLIKPKLFGDKLDFHPLLFFFLLLGSLQAFNLPGIILGPILLTLFYSFWEIYKVLEEYGTKQDSDSH